MFNFQSNIQKRLEKGDYRYVINETTRQLNSFAFNECELFYLRGIARRQIEDINGAIDDFDKASEIDPDNPEIFCTRGLFKEELKDFEGAIDDLTLAIQLDPSNAEYFLLRAELMKKT